MTGNERYYSLFAEHSTDANTYIHAHTHPYKYNHANPTPIATPMNITERLSQT
jgi:hypothetical protein